MKLHHQKQQPLARARDVHEVEGLNLAAQHEKTNLDEGTHAQNNFHEEKSQHRGFLKIPPKLDTGVYPEKHIVSISYKK